VILSDIELPWNNIDANVDRVTSSIITETPENSPKPARH
jgi:hypothetical protein